MIRVKPLMNSEHELLGWKGPFSYEGTVRIRTPTDGSCFFHAIARSYCAPYILERTDNDIPISKYDFVKKLRKDLADRLSQRVDPSDKDSPIVYDTLSRGELKDFSKSLPSFSLDNMKKELDSKSPIDNKYNEFISNEINKDIYILDGKRRDVYITGDDDDILYKGRDSIVILYLPGHYELVGIKKRDKIKTLFRSDHPFILKIRDRISEIRRNEVSLKV